MIRRAFRHEQPTTLDEALALLAAAPDDARVLSGGTWLVPDMVAGVARPSVVVDLRRIDVPAVRREDDTLVLAARATYADVLASADAAALAPLLVTMAGGVTGGAQLRNVATLVGSACQAAPASDVPGCLVALGARMRVRSSTADREVAADAFFTAASRTALGPGELLAEIAVPTGGERPHGYVKIKHAAGSWPIATASALALDDERVRLVLGAVSGVPVVADGDLDEGDALVRRLCDLVVDPWADALADAEYRRAIAPVAGRRALSRLQGATA